MTNEQVKDILHKAFEVYIDSLSGDENFTDKQLEVLTANKIIGKALDMVMPAKPVLNKDNGRVWQSNCGYIYTQHDWLCPSCRAVVGEQISFSDREKTFVYLKRNKGKRACRECGQLIDWSEEC